MSTEIKGYTKPSESQLRAVNDNKQLEELVMRVTEEVSEQNDSDLRWVSIARTHFQEGFMALNRAIMKPGRIWTTDEEALHQLVKRMSSRG